MEHLLADRSRTTSFGESVRESKKEFRIVDVSHLDVRRLSSNYGRPTSIDRFIDPYPFVPQNPLELDKRSEEIFAIQAAGLAKRLEHAGIKKVVYDSDYSDSLSKELLGSQKLLEVVRYEGLKFR